MLDPTSSLVAFWLPGLAGTGAQKGEIRRIEEGTATASQLADIAVKGAEMKLQEVRSASIGKSPDMFSEA